MHWRASLDWLGPLSDSEPTSAAHAGGDVRQMDVSADPPLLGIGFCFRADRWLTIARETRAIDRGENGTILDGIHSIVERTPPAA